MSSPTIVYAWNCNSLALCWRASMGWIIQTKGPLAKSTDWVMMATILAGKATTVTWSHGTRYFDVPGPVFLDMLRDGETGIPGIAWEEKV